MQVHEHTETLSQSRAELAASLKNLTDQLAEIQSNEKRLADTQKEERDLLTASMDEQEQVVKLSTVVAKQRLLESKVQQGQTRLESAKAALQRAAEEAFKAFWEELTTLRDARQTANLDRLRELVNAELWPRAEGLALSFVRFASDMVPLDLLGDHAHNLLRGGAVRQAAETLLQDISKLEAQKGR